MKTLLVCLLSLLPLLGMAQATPAKNQLSTHILDISTGQPAPSVTVSLSRYNAAQKTWTAVAEKKTDAAGRIADFLPATSATGTPGTYKLTFLTQPYFESKKQQSFYPFVEVVFEIKDGAHYHVPITLSPYGYSTYRGS
ncbi:hydroxyisourate hydrolase [Hymenobacter sp. DG01]|uniref:hydroxyisourate hydrolase n=1 Tax=Hymenobacter sp. DG01 TaxID=2584940 RepID=UPI0021508172|nr:hydroxyisourate hydrolase [Hymenobacter sp. DG01]